MKRFLFMVLLIFVGPRAESVAQYLSHGGREARGIDFTLGFLAGQPSGAERAEGRLGARVGLGFELPPIPLGRFSLPANLSVLYSTRAVAMGVTRWTFSLVQVQALLHHPIHPRLPWVEPAVFVSPHYTSDLVLSGAGGTVPARRSLERAFSLDLGAALVVNLVPVQFRMYYARHLVGQVAPTDLTVSALGADLLLPLVWKRKKA